MRKRIWAVLLSVCLLVGLLPTTALAGGDVAMFTVRHDPTAAADAVCTAAGQEMLLPGTHVVSAPATGWVEIGDDDGNYEVQTTFQEFTENSTDWSISWYVNIGSTSTEVASGQTTSITIDCPPLEEGQTAYYVYVNATLTATYQGKEYTVWGSTSLYIRDPIWMLSEEDQGQVYTEDRNGEETHHVPLNLPKTLTKHTSDKPKGETVTIPSDFQFSCESNPACYIDTSEDGSPYLSNPDPGRYQVTVTIRDQDGALIATQFQTYYVTDGEVLARSRLTENPNVIWTLTKDGTLTFSGDGEVTTTYTLWNDFVTQYRGDQDSSYKITRVVAKEGITSLGTYLLSTWNSNETLELVSLPSTLTELKSNVFRGYQITSATYAGKDWSAVKVGDGNDNLNRLLEEKGITLWVENNRLYGRFTDPGTGDMYNLYRLYFYDSAQASDPAAYISVGLKEPGTTIDLTNLYGHGTLDHFAVYSNGTSPNNGDDALYDVELAKPIRFEQDVFAFPFTNVTASVTESDVPYNPYKVAFSQLNADYVYELYNQDTRYSWKFEEDNVYADDHVFGACTLTAILASEQANAFLILNSEEYPITVSKDAQPALPQQEIMLPATSITRTYGSNDVYNTATNMTEGGGALTYTSADPAVAVVDAASGKVTIKGAGTITITVTAATVPGKYAETSVSYELIINRAALTIRADDATVVYGQAAPAFGWTAEGWQYEDDASILTGQAVYDCGYQPFHAVGAYPITVSGLDSQNYDITFESGTLTVSKAEEYAITLGNLEQLAGHTSTVTAAVTPYDNTAVISVEYLVDNVWTDTVPSATGAYPVRAALTASSNLVADPTNYTEGTLTVKQGVTVDTGDGTENVDVAVDVEDGTAQITIPEDDIAKITDNANGTVSIDLGGASGVDELILPGNLVSELSKSENADGLTISTEDASITMSDSVLDTVAEAVTNEEDTISVVLKSVDEEDLTDAQKEALESIPNEAKVVDVSIVVTHPDGSQDVLHELGGNVTITVPYDQVPEIIGGKYVVACHVSDNGVITYLFATCNETNRTITFTTNHLSNYAVFVSEKPAVIVTDGSGSGLYTMGDTVTIEADSKSGYTFDHWEIVSGSVSLENANSAKTTFTMPDEAVELTATYTQNSGGSSSGSSGSGGSVSYTVSVTQETGGTVTVTPGRAGKGSKVTVTVTPDEGYALELLTVTDKNGSPVELTDKGDGTYTFTMPGGAVSVKASFTELVEEPSNPFADVSQSDYYYEAVLWAVEHGVTNGTGDTTFSPDVTVTRAQMVTFLWRAHGAPEATGANPFADVSSDDYYYDAVLWAVSNGVTNGTGDTTFSPDVPVTRSQAVTLQWRAAGAPAASGSGFDDVAADTYYADAVAWAMTSGITNGTGGNRFSPDAAVSRSQAVTFLYRELA